MEFDPETAFIPSPEQLGDLDELTLKLLQVATDGNETSHIASSIYGDGHVLIQRAGDQITLDVPELASTEILRYLRVRSSRESVSFAYVPGAAEGRTLLRARRPVAIHMCLMARERKVDVEVPIPTMVLNPKAPRALC